MNDRRRIPLGDTENVRDLGGYPLGPSAMTRYGVFLRSGVPARLSADDEALIRRMNITTVIDLRSDEELDRTPCYFAGLDGFSYHHLPISGGDRMRDGEDQVGLSYYEMTMCPNIHKIFKIMANMTGGCLYHCTAGKDRTGTVSAILLLLAGADESDIVVDYSQSYPYLSRLIRSLKDDYADLPAYIGRSNPEYMEDFLKRFSLGYGSAQSFLKDCGLTDGEIGALRARLVAPLDL